MTPLWTWNAMIAAAGGRVEGSPGGTVAGFSIDTRALKPGEVFVPLLDRRDGHEFVPAAFAAGAVAALVREDYERAEGDGPLIRVDDPLAALRRIAAAARARAEGRIVAVTGSVGKTGTKEMLRAVLGRLGSTHAPEKSFNNHWGVPLTLARLPADAAYAVFEIGMNHAGEITPLTELVRPEVAIVTTVEAVHIENFSSVEGIAEAKAEIFRGLDRSGTAIINRDNPWHDVLARRAAERGARVLTFGRDPASDFRATDVTLDVTGSSVTASHGGETFRWRVGAPGAHIAQNSLAVAASLVALGLGRADIETALAALRSFHAPAGRGARSVRRLSTGTLLLIDESYNANPVSMRAALAALAMVPRDRFPRRIAVLGDMLELGAAAEDLHAGLIDAVDAAGVDLVFAAGPFMHRLFERVPAERRGGWSLRSSELEAVLLSALEAGDAVMIKGSLGSRMGPLVTAIEQRFAAAEPG